MKSKYLKLKISIMLQTTFISAIALLVGSVLLETVFEEPAEKYHDLIVTVGFLALFALFFYMALSRMTRYLDQIGSGIENVLSDSDKPIRLIAELKPLEEKLNDLKGTIKKQEQEAIELEQKKSDLLLFLAHDLKTPLTSVVAYLSMLDSNPEMTVEERAKYTHISLEKALRLGELLEEFFDITRFNLQEIELITMELNLSLMLEQIADELYGVLQERHLTCRVEVEDDLSVEGDPDRLARVFDNILRNAVAYCTPETELVIYAYRMGSDVIISFENQGEDIPKEKLTKLFEKFYRADSARSSATGGAGLGLAIAKEIVELHGGTIRAESEDGWIRMRVILPQKREEKKNEVHAFGGRSSRSRAGKRNTRVGKEKSGTNAVARKGGSAMRKGSD